MLIVRCVPQKHVKARPLKGLHWQVKPRLGLGKAFFNTQSSLIALWRGSNECWKSDRPVPGWMRYQLFWGIGMRQPLYILVILFAQAAQSVCPGLEVEIPQQTTKVQLFRPRMVRTQKKIPKKTKRSIRAPSLLWKAMRTTLNSKKLLYRNWKHLTDLLLRAVELRASR